MPKLAISRTALNDIRELKRDHGIDCTPDEIVRLHLAGVAIERPGGGDRLDLIGVPVQCGGAWLFRMTVAGAIWWQDLALGWFRNRPGFSTYAIAFCLAHGRDADTLQRLRTRDEAYDAISKWAASLNVTRAELEDAIDRVMPPSTAPRPRCQTCRQELPDDSDDDVSIRPVDWESIVHEIALATGTEPSYWFSRTSMDACIRAFYRARQILASKCGYSAPGAPDALTEAIKRERAIVAEIVQSRRAAAAAAAAAPTPETPS